MTKREDLDVCMSGTRLSALPVGISVVSTMLQILWLGAAEGMFESQNPAWLEVSACRYNLPGEFIFTWEEGEDGE